MYVRWSEPVNNFFVSHRQPPDEIKKYPLFESFEVGGRFWVPNETNQDCCGIVRQRPGDGVQLELYDPPPALCQLSGIRVDVIHGKLANGASCSLFGCWGIVKTYGVEEKHYQALINVERMIDGRHFISPSDCLLVNLACQFTHLTSWFDDPYEIIPEPGFNEFEIRFAPDNVKVDLEFDSVKFSVEFECLRSLPDIQSGRLASQYQYCMRICTPNPYPLSWFLSIASMLRACMIFLIGYGIYTLHLGATFPTDSGSKPQAGPSSGRIFQAVDIPSTLMGDSNHFSTNYETIKGSFANILQSWFDNHHAMKVVTRGYVAILLNDGAYVESMFLNIVQVLEHFHGIIFPTERRYMPRKDWRAFIGRLSECSSPILIELLKLAKDEIEKLNKLLIGRIASLNKLSFRSRLTQLFNGVPIPCLMPLIGNPDRPDEAIESLLRKIEATRHFLTHHEQEYAENALFGRDLRDAIISCWAVLTFWIARKLGFSDEVADNIALNTSRTMFLASKKSEL